MLCYSKKRNELFLSILIISEEKKRNVRFVCLCAYKYSHRSRQRAQATVHCAVKISVAYSATLSLSQFSK